MTLLALDMAYGNIGYTVWRKGKPVDCGVIMSEKCKDRKLRVSDWQADQCAEMAMKLKGLIEDHDIRGIVGEIPGGSQSAKAAKCNGMVTALVASVAYIIGVPVEYCTPDAVKKATAGKKNASKTEIMDWVVGRFGGRKAVTEVKVTKGKRAGKVSERVDYMFLEAKFPKTKFEHVADSVGAYMASRSGNLVRMFG